MKEIPPKFEARIKQAKELKLKELDLSNDWNTDDTDKLKEIPATVLELKQLKSLNLSGNKLTDLPGSISELSNLTWLNLNNNQLINLPESIGKLSNLTELDLRYNRLTNLPKSIGNLSKLTKLFLRKNQLASLPEFLSQLSNLTELDFSHNKLTSLPESISQLSNLTQLDLSQNKLTSLPESISKISKLTQLDLRKNQLTKLPKFLSQLSNLTELNLSCNQLTNLPEFLSELSNLTKLNLTSNQLTKLPKSITQLSNLTQLYLKENPLVSPPIEIAEKGIKAIREYFRQWEEQEVDYLYEAKLLIVGEAGAGKTTLAKKIQDQDYQLQVEEKSTEGIDVINWYFLCNKGNQERNFRINIWDFGGQEIYHATHQFFLTKRSLYALVLDTRTEDTDLDYWLNIVELLSDNSPLLIIKNEKQNRKREINQRGLRGQFTNLEKTLATNLKTNRGLEEILKQVQHYITTLPHVGDELPKTWKLVREILEIDERDYISLEEYLEICQKNGFTERKHKLQLSGYLHDLGVCLHFQDDPLLNKTVILKPEWGTAAVYKVLDNDTVRNKLGKFTLSDLEDIWGEKQYENARDELLQLMIKFKLCYKIPNDDIYIAPQLLTEEEPTYPWQGNNNLILRYTYEFMPKGIVTQFIVAMHEHIWQQQYVWKSGVILEKDQTFAEVIEYYGKREIKIRVVGKQKRDLLIAVTHELDKIHDSYNRLKYNKLIPCNCQKCQNNQDSYFYPLKDLQDFVAAQEYEIQCRKSFKMVNVLSLIDDTTDWRQSFEDRGRGVEREEEYLEIIKTLAAKPINNVNNNIQGDGNMTGERKIKITGGTINNTGAGAFSLGDINGTVANLINQLPESNSQEQEIKQLLSQLQNAISNETSLEEEDKSDALEEVKNLVEATQNPDEGKKKTAKKAIRILKGIFTGLPTATEVVQNLDKLLEAISQLPGLGG